MKIDDIRKSHIKTVRTWLVFAAFLFLFLSPPAKAQLPGEINTKAVFLFNFTQFVEWPFESNNNSQIPFVIGILGEDPFQKTIDSIVTGEKVKEQAIVVQRYQDIKEIQNCEVLFISNKGTEKVSDLLTALQNKRLLTVSDIPDFAASGGMIGFVTREGKVKIQVNLSAAKAAGLTISSKLLSVAEIVK